VQKYTFHPPEVLHMNGHIQTQGFLNALAGDFLIADIVLGYHLVYDISGDHPYDDKNDQGGK
jgi:hypothetical protein